jgi:glycosyltransferase involved in cell wall biosynthesis
MRDETTIRTVSRQGGLLEDRCRALGPLDIVSDRRGLKVWLRDVIRRERRPLLGLSLRRWKPDLIYVNSVAALPMLDELPCPDTPVLCHVHELDSYLGDVSSRHPRLWRRPARFIAVSQAVREALVDRYDVPPEKVRTVDDFVREADFSTEPFDAAGDAAKLHGEVQSAREARPFVVGGAGRVDLRKGPTLWLQLAAALTRILGKANVRFVWVGVQDDDMCRYFRQIAVRLGVEEVTTFVPVTRHPLAHFRQFDVFAQTAWEDPCPIVVLENMMLRVPVACFAGSGGAPEEVGETGIVVDGFCPQAMAREIAALLGDEPRRRSMGEAARQRVIERFTDRVQVPKLLREILAAAGKGPSHSQDDREDAKGAKADAKERS